MKVSAAFVCLSASICLYGQPDRPVTRAVPQSLKDGVVLSEDSSHGPPPEETLRLVRAVRDLKSSPNPALEGASEVLRANEILIPKIFQITVDRLEGFQARQEPAESVLEARWTASARTGVRAVGVRDSYRNSMFLLELPGSAAGDLQKLLTNLLVWRSGALNLRYVEGRRRKPANGITVLTATSVISRPEYPDQEFTIAGTLSGSDLHLCVTIGKLLIGSHYPEGYGVARQRFPPMVKVAPSLDAAAITARLQQIGATNEPLDPYASDGMELVRELARRGASDDELFEAAYRSTGNPLVRGTWMSCLRLPGVDAARFLERKQLVDRILEASRTELNDCGARNCSDIVFSAWAAARSPSVEKIALAWVREAKNPAPALDYLRRTSSSPETLEALRRASLTGDAARSRDAAIRQIERQIAEEKRREEVRSRSR